MALAGAVALAGLAATAALALLCFVKVVGLVLLGAPRRPECAAAIEAPLGMRAGMAALARCAWSSALVPGLIVPTLAGLAPGASDDVLTRHAGLAVPGTGSLPALGLALALLVLTAALVARARDAARRARADVGVRAAP